MRTSRRRLPSSSSRASSTDPALAGVEDVTPEARLRQLEARAEAFMRAMGEVSWTTDASGLVVEDAPTWRALTGKSVEQMRGRGWLDAVHPDDRAIFEPRRLSPEARQNPREVTFRLRRADGVYRTMQGRAAPVIAADGSVREWVGVCRDVTEQEARRVETEHRTRQFEAILAAVPERLAIFDAAGRLVLRNPTSIIYGSGNPDYASPDEIPEATDLRTLDGRPLRVDEMPLSRVLRGEPAAEMEMRMRTTSGEIQQIVVTAAPFFEASGALAGVVTLTRDVTLARQIEQRVAEHAGQLQAIFDTLTDALLVYDANGRLVQMNAAARTLFRLDLVPVDPDFAARPYAERVAAAGIMDAKGRPISPDEWGVPRLLRGDTLTGDAAIDIQIRIGDGKLRQFNLTGAPIRDAAGVITGAVVLCHDVTERRALEREALERASQLEATFEAMANGVVIYDTTGTLVSMNAEAREIFALTGGPEFSREPIEERTAAFSIYDEAGSPVPPENWPGRRLLRGEVLKGDQAMDVRFRRLDGEEIWLTITGAPVRDAHGGIIGAIAVYSDVTARRLAQRRTHDVLEALLAMAQILVSQPSAPTVPDASEDALTRAVRSPVAQRLADLTRSVLGCTRVLMVRVEPETQLVHPVAMVGFQAEQEAQWWREQERRQARLGEGPDPTQTARFLSGEPVIVDMTQPPYDHIENPYGITTTLIAPLRVGGRIVGALSLDYGGSRHEFTADEIALTEAVGQLSALVIERERLLHERTEAEARVLALEEVKQRMEQFIGMVSHELRTPITTTKTNVQLAQRRAARLLDADPTTMSIEHLRTLPVLLERAERQIGRLDRLVGDLLDISRIQVDKLELRFERDDLRTLVRNVVQELRLNWPNREMRLTSEPPRAVPVEIDAHRIEQVLGNYLTNALKYAPPESPIDVALTVADDIARVSVRDEGPGLPPEEQERIWDLFHQAEGIEHLNGANVGLGLGLYISKSIVERHAGAVGVESEPGHGSTFWFTLPVASASARQERASG